MALSSELISRLVKVTNDKESNINENVVYGTIVDDGTRKYVQLDGSDLSTPIIKTTDINTGDRVIVQVKNHTATVTGNITDPAIGTKRANGIESSITQTADEINLRVTNEVSGLSTRITQNATDITSLAEAQGGLSTRITQNATSITSLVSNQTEFSQFQQTVEGFSFMNAGGTVKINGGDIYLTGMITWADMTDDLKVDVEQVGKDAENAANSANSASSSASSASTSATNASNSASSALSSASNAASSARDAANSASNASTSASNAASSASIALTNATSTQEAYAATQKIADNIANDVPSYLTNTTITDVSLMSPVIIGGVYYAISQDSWLEMTSDGLYMYTDGIYYPKVSIINDNTVIRLILGAGQDYGENNRLYLLKGSNYAQLYFKDGAGNTCGLQFNSGGTVSLIGSWE